MRLNEVVLAKISIFVLIILISILIALFLTNIIGSFVLNLSIALLILVFLIMLALFPELKEMFVVFIVFMIIILLYFSWDVLLSVVVGIILLVAIAFYILFKK